MDDRNLPMSLNVEDRRDEYGRPPTRQEILMSLIRGLLQRPPPPLTRVETYTGDPNQQYGDTRLPQLGTTSRGTYAGIPSAPPVGR